MRPVGRSLLAGVRTIPELFAARVELSSHLPAYRFFTGGGWRSVTWREFANRVEEAAVGLLELGLRPGDTVTIVGETRPEWCICDLAVLSAGGRTCGIYPSSPPAQLARAVRLTKSRFLVVDTAEQLERVRRVAHQMESLERIIVWRGEQLAGERELPVHRLYQLGRRPKTVRRDRFREQRRRIDPDQPAVLVFTAGTTGAPRAAVFTHRNVLSTLASAEVFGLSIEDTTVSFLPMCHAAERIVGFYGRLATGMSTTFARSPDTVLEDVRENRPTVLGCPPRLLDRVYDTVHREVEAGGWLRSKAFQRALDLGETVASYRLEERPLPPLLKARQAVADRLWFLAAREHLGGNIRMVLSGAAPARREVMTFFHAVGVPVYETYGLTESGGLATANVPGATRIGTVGRSLPGYQVRVGEGGEVLVRGGGVFVGYLGADGEPAALDGLDSEGWLQTGDVGRLDRDGYLTITERKSDIIVTSTGKNVAPHNIEGLIRRDRAVGHVVVVGDRRPYLSALVTLEPDEAPFLARTLGIPFRGLDQLSREPAVVDFVRGQIDRANEELSRVEQVRRFTVLPEHLSVERGLVTPTLELRRQQILEDYADEIESMYR